MLWVFIVVHGLSVAAWGLSLVAEHGLSCPAACGILVPQSGIKPTPPCIESTESYLLGHLGSPTVSLFCISQSYRPWGGQSTGVSALASFPPKKSQGWSPSEWTGWISLQSKGLSGVFSNTTVQKHQFFSTQLSSQSNSHIHTWPQEKP